LRPKYLFVGIGKCVRRAFVIETEVYGQLSSDAKVSSLFRWKVTRVTATRLEFYSVQVPAMKKYSHAQLYLELGTVRNKHDNVEFYI